MATIHHFPPVDPQRVAARFANRPLVRALTPEEADYLRRELAPIRAGNELRRIRERRQRLQRVVTAAALVVAVFCLIYFSFQIGRGAL